MKDRFLPAVIVMLAATLLALAAPGPAKDKPVQSAWAAEPVKVDGLDMEWPAAALTPEEGGKVGFGFRNDDRDLYLVFVFNDPKALSSIEATGMTVYFNVEDKKKKDNGVVFKTKRVSALDLIAGWERDGQAVSDERRREIMTRPFYVVYESEVVNKKQDKPEPVPAGAVPASPPYFRNALRDKVAVYEFRIPLSRAGQPGGIGAAPGGAIKVGFEWGGMTEDMRKAMMARRAAAGSQAVSMDTSMSEDSIKDGDERADAGREGPSSFQRGPKKHSFWVDLKLAPAPGGF